MKKGWLTNISKHLDHETRLYLKNIPGGFYIGDPKPTKEYTVEQLKDMVRVGVYQ